MEVLALLFLVYGASVQASQEPCELSARTENGIVCGTRVRAANGDTIASFLGMPYARAPVGELRFAEPQPPYNYTGFFNASISGPVCPQIPKAPGVPMDPTSTGEDCLHVNVHVPLDSLPSSGRKKPLLKVLVFVHGGAFESGSGDPDSYGPEYLTTKGIIVVTMNYRLGIFGFLSLNSPEIPGNAGLRDIIFSLKWVKRNIRNFGGDPDDVTLGGVSGGATLAHLVAVSPLTKGQGLFTRVLVMSGTAISDFYTTSPALAKLISTIFLYEMDINLFQTPAEIHKQLIKAPLEKIYKALRGLFKAVGMRLTFMPVVETPVPNFSTVIPKDPERLVEEGIDKDYKILVGFTEAECATYAKSFLTFIPKMSSFPPLSLPPRMLFAANFMTLPEITEKVKQEFFNGSLPDLESYTKMCNIGYYQYPTLRLVEKRRQIGAEPTWVYQFSYQYRQVENVLKKDLNLTWVGAAHTEDLSYVFRTNVLWKEPTHTDELSLPESDFQMRNWMTTLFANFVKYGQPTEDPTLWPPSGKKFEHLFIGEPFKYDVIPAPPYMLKKKRFFDQLQKLGQM